VKGWEEVEAFALTLPSTEPGTSYRQPAVKVAGKTFISTGHEPGSFHVRSPMDEKAVLMGTDPVTFWQTPHYAPYPSVLVRYGDTDAERVRLVIRRAWWDMASPRLRREAGERP
jgi:hypothetical protein